MSLWYLAAVGRYTTRREGSGHFGRHAVLGMTASTPGGPGCGLLATPQRSARMPLLVPGVPCTMSRCVYPCGHRGVHREARPRVMPASHPPMPCDPPAILILALKTYRVWG